jgi:predicted nucleic acid-binding Zn ribbon protein
MSLDVAPPGRTDTTISKTCPQCGVTFSHERYRGHGLRRYCSPTCREAAEAERMWDERTARHPPQSFVCRQCGAPTVPIGTVGRPKSVYCSDACKEEHRAARQKTEREATRSGRPCRACGGPIPLELSLRATTCSITCGDRYQNNIRAERARLARSQRPRPPCLICGTTIAPERRRNTIYCSEACKRIAVATKYRARNPDVGLARYQMQPGDYDALLLAQGGRCAICGADEAGGKGGRFHVDHNHATGRVRGLLCHGCNLGIGMLRDDPDVMRAAIRYVERKS